MKCKRNGVDNTIMSHVHATVIANGRDKGRDRERKRERQMEGEFFMA